MKRKYKILKLLLIIPLFLITSCSAAGNFDNNPKNDYDEKTSYVIKNEVSITDFFTQIKSKKFVNSINSLYIYNEDFIENLNCGSFYYYVELTKNKTISVEKGEYVFQTNALNKNSLGVVKAKFKQIIKNYEYNLDLELYDLNYIINSRGENSTIKIEEINEDTLNYISYSDTRNKYTYELFIEKDGTRYIFSKLMLSVTNDIDKIGASNYEEYLAIYKEQLIPYTEAYASTFISNYKQINLKIE